MDMQNLYQALSADPRHRAESAGLPRIDSHASAALAEAVRSARQGLKPSPSSAYPDNARSGAVLKALSSRGMLLTQAAAALLLAGTGWLAFSMGTTANRDAIHRMEAEAARSQQVLAKLADDLAALKSTMSSVRDVEQTSSISKASQQAKLAEKVDRLAIAVQDPGKKIAALEDKIDHMESQIMASLNGLSASKPAVAAPAPAPAPAPAAPEPDKAPAAKEVKSEPVEGWTLREVYDGSALVESRNHSLYEVGPGNVIPGVGKVQSVERRGGRWVVVTDKGTIGTYR